MYTVIVSLKDVHSRTQLKIWPTSMSKFLFVEYSVIDAAILIKIHHFKFFLLLQLINKV